MSNQTDENKQNNRGESDKKARLRSIWLGVQDSNLRMPVPKTGALPLGQPPSITDVEQLRF